MLVHNMYYVVLYPTQLEYCFTATGCDDINLSEWIEWMVSLSMQVIWLLKTKQLQCLFIHHNN